MMLLLTVVLILGLLPASVPAPYIVQPDFAEAIEALPMAPAEPTDSSGVPWQRQREKAILLDGIKNRILTSLKLRCTPRAPPHNTISNEDRLMLIRVVNNMERWSDGRGQSDLLKRAQSFYPSCDHPAEQDPSLARLMPSLDVYFNLTSFFPTVPKDATIEEATLRVFKVAGPGTSPVLGTSIPLVQVADQGPTVRVSLHAYAAPTNASAQPKVTSWSGDVTPWSGDVTPWSGGWSPPEVSDTPRLVDEVTVPASRHGWLTFDVHSAVRAWKVGAANWGFLLTVEEESGRRLQPDRFFQDMECDVAVPSSPVPGLLMQVAREKDLDVQSEQRYPVLDLLTSEPAADVSLPGGATLAADQPCPSPSSGDSGLRGDGPLRRRHRHRHSRQRRIFRRQARSRGQR